MEDATRNAANNAAVLTPHFVSAGCNRVLNACDASPTESIAAFGAANCVILFDIETSQVIATLKGHKGRVNCVRFSPSGNLLVSGCSGGLVIGWQIEHIPAQTDQPHTTFLQSWKWKQLFCIKNAHSAVTGVCIKEFELASADQQSSKIILFASTGTDGLVQAWVSSLQQLGEQPPLKCLSINLFPKFAEAISIMFNPSTRDIFVTFGAVDKKIHVHCTSIETLVSFFQTQQQQSGASPELSVFFKGISLSGHEGWIQCIDGVVIYSQQNSGESQGHLIIASASQDNRIRLWRFVPHVQSESKSEESAVEKKVNSLTKGKLIKRISQKTNASYVVSSESVLIGHEDWVRSVRWKRSPSSDDIQVVTSANQTVRWCDWVASSEKALTLLSSSSDKSMQVWVSEMEKGGGVWINEWRVGELGGNVLGFLGGFWSPSGQSLLAYDQQGAFHHWQQTEDGWVSLQSISGHSSPVQSICWEKDGKYLTSVSEDMTCRTFSEWKSLSTKHKKPFYCEIGRPQVHGHPLSCVTTVPPHGLVSGGEEKVLRVFQGPNAFLETLGSASQTTPETDDHRPLGAIVPPLGLSNKAVFPGNWTSLTQQFDGTDGVAPPPKPQPHIDAPPLESDLMQSTLWPEMMKMYGHPNNSMSFVQVNHAGTLLASACRATSAQWASVFLWSTHKWQQLAALQGGHKLTVIQAKFSPDDKFLLTVSRDRSICIYSITETDHEIINTMSDEANVEYSIPSTKVVTGVNCQLILKLPKAHERIIWACSWLPSGPNGYRFATASRDKTFKVWSIAQKGVEASCLATQSMKASVTALDCHAEKDWIAVGLESGELKVYSMDGNVLTLLCESEKHNENCAAVTKLLWRPHQQSFATCSDDHTVRLYQLDLV